MESICVFCPLSWSLYFVFQMLNQVVNGVVLFHGGHLWHCSPPFSTPHNLKTLYFVFCILYFILCNLYFKCSTSSFSTLHNRKTAPNSKANTRTKNSITTFWPLMIIYFGLFTKDKFTKEESLLTLKELPPTHNKQAIFLGKMRLRLVWGGFTRPSTSVRVGWRLVVPEWVETNSVRVGWKMVVLEWVETNSGLNYSD